MSSPPPGASHPATEARFLVNERFEAVAIAFDGKALEFHCNSAFAPGQPVRLTQGALGIEGRVLGCRRDDAAEAFAIRLRLVSLSKPNRARLAALFSAAQ